MTTLVPMLSGGVLALGVFLIIAAFIVFGSINLRGHIRKANAPWESELTEAGRKAQDLEHPGI